MVMPDTAIRPATLDDTDAVGEVLSRSYPALLAPHYDADLLSQALPLLTRANPRLIASGTYYVAAEEGGRLLGCGGWTRERPGTGEIVAGLGHLRHFAVEAAFAGLGIGKRLLAHSLAEARAQGIGAVECYATLGAEPFYRSAGFVTVKPIDVAMGPLSFPSLLMTRELS